MDDVRDEFSSVVEWSSSSFETSRGDCGLELENGDSLSCEYFFHVDLGHLYYPY